MESILLSSFEKKAVSLFRQDLTQMLRVAKNIDRYYAESRSELDEYLKKFDVLVEAFNKKYKGIKFRVSVNSEKINFRLYLKEKSIQECFANSASKILGLQSIGTSKFGAVGISEGASFAREVEKAKDKLYITYYNPETGHSNVFLQNDKKEKMVELVYDPEEICHEPSPEFQLLAFYALSNGYNKNTDINALGATLGFSIIPYHAEKAEYFRKFDRHIGE